MLHVKRAATIALTSALADWEAGDPLSLITIREIRLAHSLLVDGEPSGDELRPFLGDRPVVPWRGRSPSVADASAISEAEYTSAQIRAVAARLCFTESFVAARLRDTSSGPHPRSAKAISDIFGLMADASFQQQHEDDDRWE